MLSTPASLKFHINNNSLLRDSACDYVAKPAVGIDVQEEASGRRGGGVTEPANKDQKQRKTRRHESRKIKA